jgi:hypothetical protein
MGIYIFILRMTNNPIKYPHSFNNRSCHEIEKHLLGASNLFFCPAFAFSLLFWGVCSLAAKIGLFVLGFGLGAAAGQWAVRRKVYELSPGGRRRLGSRLWAFTSLTEPGR